MCTKLPHQRASQIQQATCSGQSQTWLTNQMLTLRWNLPSQAPSTCLHHPSNRSWRQAPHEQIPPRRKWEGQSPLQNQLTKAKANPEDRTKRIKCWSTCVMKPRSARRTSAAIRTYFYHGWNTLRSTCLTSRHSMTSISQSTATFPSSTGSCNMFMVWSRRWRSRTRSLYSYPQISCRWQAWSRKVLSTSMRTYRRSYSCL